MKTHLILGALLGAALLSGMALFGPLAREARGNFTLSDGQQMTVNTTHSQGTLYDTSRAFIVSGGSVYDLFGYDRSTVDISGGVVTNLNTFDASAANISGGLVGGLVTHGSTVDISGGQVNYISTLMSSTLHVFGGLEDHIWAYDASTVDISGGNVYCLMIYGTSTAVISGGSVNAYLCTYNTSVMDISSGLTIVGGSPPTLEAYNTSVATFHARDFSVHEGLWLDGDRVLGTGVLTGEWTDGTLWAVNIICNDSTATIRVIPEPATLSLLALSGALALLRRRSASS